VVNVLGSSVSSVDSTKSTGQMTFDGEVSDWPALIREALTHVAGLTVVSLDDRQAFLARKVRWLQPIGGIQLAFASGPGRNELTAEAISPPIRVRTSGTSELKELFEAIAFALSSNPKHT
jgi:hypothetical protein